jgi:hypothetical protein
MRTLWFLALILAACGVEPGHAPVARISAAPRAILENDGFRTDVVLDGSASEDPVDDPENSEPLDYLWTVENDEFRVEDGSLSSARVTLRLLGARPATVRLTVTDGDGKAATARTQLQLTIR